MVVSRRGASARAPRTKFESVPSTRIVIRDCVAAAENHADARIQNVLISINCGQPVSVTSRAVMALDGDLVTDAHLRALLAEGRAKCVLEGHEIIQSAPTAYVVDEARGVSVIRGKTDDRIAALAGPDVRRGHALALFLN